MDGKRPPFDPDRVGMGEPDEGLDRLAYEVIGAAIEVHRFLGPGYLESVYQNALAQELTLRNTSFVREHPVPIVYKGAAVGGGELDFLIENQLVIETKAIDQLAPIHTAQVISYLKATRLKLGLLINFNVPVLKDGIRRVVL